MVLSLFGYMCSHYFKKWRHHISKVSSQFWLLMLKLVLMHFTVSPFEINYFIFLSMHFLIICDCVEVDLFHGISHCRKGWQLAFTFSGTVFKFLIRRWTLLLLSFWENLYAFKTGSFTRIQWRWMFCTADYINILFIVCEQTRYL